MDVTDPSQEATVPGEGPPRVQLRVDAPGVRLARAAVLGAMFGDEPSERVGRYTPIRRLGAGASGVVYLARDTALQRDVALKLLATDDYEPLSAAGSRRYLHEARAIARLSHPNVVEIFDVGVQNGMPYLAMELVDGGALDDWLTEAPRSHAEIIHAFLQAAEGLAAAHGAGIVHRDFKPANVLIGRDGRVRVADFGLAGVVAGETDASGDSQVSGDPLALTRTGAVLGTPAFMAPEQHRGEPADARADQYAFCASLWSALHGVRPFVADSIAGLYHAKIHARFEREGDVPTPTRWDAALRRGLSPAAVDRWPSMRALIGALRPRQRRTAFAVAGVGALALGLTGIALASAEPESCEAMAAEIDPSWDRARREALVRHLRSIQAEPLLSRAEPRLDAFVATWGDARRTVCESAVGEAESSTSLDARMQCLRQARARLDATYELLVALEPNDVPDAADLVVALDPPHCAGEHEGDAGSRPRPSDPATARIVDDVRARRAALAPKIDTLRLRPQDPEIVALLQAAEDSGYGPVRAEMLVMRGRLHDATGEPAGALADHERAHGIAIEHGDAAIAFDAAVGAYRLTGGRIGTPESADRWGAYAEAALARLGSPPFQRARYDDARSAVVLARDDVAAAIEHAERAVDGFAALDPPQPRIHAAAMSNLSQALRRAERFDDALAVNRRAIAMLEREIGPEHRLTIATRYGLALTLLDQGDREEGKVLLEETLAAARRALPARHAWLAAMENEAGNLARRLGEMGEARDHYERALVASDGATGIARARLVLGITGSLAETMWAQGAPQIAVARLHEALAVGRAELDETDPEIMLNRWRLGSALRRAHRDAEARATLQRVLDDASADTPDIVARVRFDLAQLEGDPDRARTLAEQARAQWATDTPLSTARPYPEVAQLMIEQIDAWLAARP